MTISDPAILVTCEHGGNDVPPTWESLFTSPGARADLRSHRGLDPGAAVAAELMATQLKCPLIQSRITRLLVDLNRSIDHGEAFSKYSHGLSVAERTEILQAHYHPYRQRVMGYLRDTTARGKPIIHLGIHTFTARYRRTWRPIDIGLLFDPERRIEAQLCTQWRNALLTASPRLRVEFNKPYLGTDDGLTTTCRAELGDDQYAGIEVEISNRFYKRQPANHLRLAKLLCTTLPCKTQVSDENRKASGCA